MSYVLGIDLGTTFTAAAVSRNGRVEIVGLGNHSSSIPSAVLLRDDGELLVGDAAARRGQQEPSRLAKEFKRRLGDATPIILGHTPYSSERLMAAVVRHVVDTVTERQGGPPSSVDDRPPRELGSVQAGAARAGGHRRRRVATPGSSPNQRRPPSTSRPASGSTRAASSRSTTSAAARSTPPCCGGSATVSSRWASPRASSASAASTSTRR